MLPVIALQSCAAFILQWMASGPIVGNAPQHIRLWLLLQFFPTTIWHRYFENWAPSIPHITLVCVITWLTRFGAWVNMCVCWWESMGSQDIAESTEFHGRLHVIEGDVLTSNLQGPFDLVIVMNMFSWLPRFVKPCLGSFANVLLFPISNISKLWRDAERGPCRSMSSHLVSTIYRHLLCLHSTHMVGCLFDTFHLRLCFRSFLLQGAAEDATESHLICPTAHWPSLYRGPCERR